MHNIEALNDEHFIVDDNNLDHRDKYLIATEHSRHRWNRSTFLRTGAGTGLNKSDRTGPAGLPV